MSSEKMQNLQDTFLNFVRKNKVPLTIFLVNGVKLQGIVTWFDNFCLLLRRDGHSQLVYKHAISTIMPGHTGPKCLSQARKTAKSQGNLLSSTFSPELPTASVGGARTLVIGPYHSKEALNATSRHPEGAVRRG